MGAEFDARGERRANRIALLAPTEN